MTAATAAVVAIHALPESAVPDCEAGASGLRLLAFYGAGPTSGAYHPQESTCD
eukprot:CAMPEP_0185582148 /NCGR_PEP_ID=MMETSP0434-20130131/19940_1 /TAXON_ID=626734 ORGANISM="Favella taraikaensis, Strain Fe Narragansett Bay" /NCGR_SAMPLE_ID=MMETSP0434 /ASSEMBLY_ACC=CAM_ASM_000379 /LENGTH=52 /DNA_ID=CAMNT_0028200881 /DNA_START=920 /DNA_END=1078 /DNA_ORIENTATION=-